MTSASLSLSGSGFSGVPPFGEAGDPSSVLSFTASSFAVAMSVRIAAEIEDETKPSAENKMIGIASTQVHFRKLWISGSTRLLFDAFSLSAVTALSFAAGGGAAGIKLAS